MKKVIIFSCIMVVGMSFNSFAQQSKTRSNVSFSDEATYKLDRRLAAAQCATTDNGGSVGPGNGGTYGAYYYRSMAYKNAALIAKRKNGTIAMK